MAIKTKVRNDRSTYVTGLPIYTCALIKQNELEGMCIKVYLQNVLTLHFFNMVASKVLLKLTSFNYSNMISAVSQWQY